MRRLPKSLSPGTDNHAALPLPGLRPGVVMVGEAEEAELRDLQLGQVVKLGEVAAIIVGLLDGTRDAEALLRDAGRALGEELNPMGLVELLQALDRRALLDTPRARMVVAQGLVRADIAALQKLARRHKPLQPYAHVNDDEAIDPPRMATGSRFTCNSCNRCCSEQHLLGPVTRAERDKVLTGFAAADDDRGSDPSNFIPLPTGAAEPLYLLRPRNGHCSYLADDGMCRVHQVLGLENKPAVCRMFPFRPVRTPTGWDAGLSLSCPTVARGGGDEPVGEAESTVTALRVISTQLNELPAHVPLCEGVLGEYSRWQRWETETLTRLHAEADPAKAWLESVESFVAVADLGDGGEQTVTVERTEDDESFVPHVGMGLNDDDDRVTADILLKDMSFWAELLVGLEAADPMALRRFRSGALRLRHDLGHSPEAAPVLAEQARLKARQEPTDGEAWAIKNTDQHKQLAESDFHQMPVSGSDPEVQRRFLAQALMSKRPFDYGTVGRGLVAMTLFLALLRLETVPGDEMHPRLEDIAYLLHHPQLTDIIDTRASVRAKDVAPGVHAALLGL